jgi:hypothetical protein
LELPILSVMGGIRLSESEMVLQLATLVMRGLTAMTWPLWLIATGIAVFRKQPKWEYQPTGYAPYLRVATHLWATSALLLVMWAFILPITQPEQQLRGRVERALVGGQVAEGLALMSVHEPGDFPPHWDPPPRVAYREQRPDITEIQEQLSGVEVKPWVRDIFDDKFSNWLLGDHRIEGALAGLPASEIERRIKLIEDMPARQKVLRENEDHLRRLTDEYSALPPDLKKRIRSLLEEAAILVPASSSAAAATDPWRLGAKKAKKSWTLFAPLRLDVFAFLNGVQNARLMVATMQLELVRLLKTLPAGDALLAVDIGLVRTQAMLRFVAPALAGARFVREILRVPHDAADEHRLVPQVDARGRGDHRQWIVGVLEHRSCTCVS